MPSPETILKREKQLLDGIIQILVGTLSPQQIILFGSRGKGNAPHGSDFDIAVDQEKPPLACQQTLDEKIEDIAGLYKVDMVYLKSVEEDFRKIVLQTGKVIYERS